MNANLRKSLLRRCAPGGFTLFELLLAIGLLAILLAVITPALVNTAESWRSTECLHKLHHLSVAMTRFRTDRNQRMWNLDPPENGGEGGLAPATIFYNYGVIKSAKEMCCPSAATASKGAWKTGGYASDVNYTKEVGNQYVSYSVNGMTFYRMTPWKLSISVTHFLYFVNNESRTPLFMDGYAYGLNMNSWQPDKRFSYVALRHKNRANVLFMDGHIEALGKREVEKLDPYGGTNPEWLKDFGIP